MELTRRSARLLIVGPSILGDGLGKALRASTAVMASLAFFSHSSRSGHVFLVDGAMMSKISEQTTKMKWIARLGSVIEERMRMLNGGRQPIERTFIPLEARLV